MQWRFQSCQVTRAGDVHSFVKRGYNQYHDGFRGRSWKFLVLSKGAITNIMMGLGEEAGSF